MQGLLSSMKAACVCSPFCRGLLNWHPWQAVLQSRYVQSPKCEASALETGIMIDLAKRSLIQIQLG